MRLPVMVGLGLIVGVLGGCATIARTPSPAPSPSPDCSFRSATSCWTPTTRFPGPRPEPADSAPGRILAPPAVVLASESDSTR